MRKLIKYSFLVFVYLIFFVQTIKADIVKPNNSINPFEVVKIQLAGLKKNDYPFKDAGIEQTWEFAHPNNQRSTGPLEKFKMMLKGDSFSMLINHDSHKVQEVWLSDDVATFEVIVLGNDKKYYGFKWQVEKFIGNGPLKGCWLTTAVSLPMSLGSAI